MIEDCEMGLTNLYLGIPIFLFLSRLFPIVLLWDQMIFVIRYIRVSKILVKAKVIRVDLAEQPS